MNNLEVKVTTQTVGGAVHFYVEFNRKPTGEERARLPIINLSREHEAYFRLDLLSEHNGHGAVFNGTDVAHGGDAREAYVQRVKDDIIKGWLEFAAN